MISDGTGRRGEEAGHDIRVLVLWENGGASYRLGAGDEAKLGRHADCEIGIALPSVSRRHARLCGASSVSSAADALATVEDIGGMNGVCVRGQKIPTNVPVPVSAGDVIELGGALVVLHPPRLQGAIRGGALVIAPAPAAAREDPMRAVDRWLDVIAQSDVSVLLAGEPGVGKTFAAEAIHARSPRAAKRVVHLNCAALPGPLLERELFGYERGAFDGATAPHAGIFESAAGGTVVLDEIDELTPALQDQLLAVIDASEVRRLGAVDARKIDFRVVASTSRDLVERVAAGAFRRALYDRLAGITIAIPALRERTGEIPRFAARFLADAASKAGRPAPRLSNEALGTLVHHAFPGNIRELKSTMERAALLARAGYVGREHLFFDTQLAGDAEVARARERRAAASAFATTRRFAPIAPTEPPDAPPAAGTAAVVVPPAPRAPDVGDVPSGAPRPRKT